jgi:GT2 family glycosyltransferase
MSSNIRSLQFVHTSKMPDVSVIIINYNTFALTSQCIRSVIEKTQDVSYEIILVDNASTEMDPQKFLETFPDITLIRNSKNEGFAGGNNRGIVASKGENILLLNSDVILKNNAIKLSLDRLKQSDKIGALSCKLLYPDERVQPVAGRFPQLTREIKDLLRLTKNLNQAQRAELYLGTEFDYKTEREVDWIWGTLFRRSVLSMFPKHELPADYFMYMEDVLWCYRLRQAGFKILYHPAGEVYHLMAGSSTEKNTDSFQRYSKTILPNEYDFIKKSKGIVYTKFFYLVKALNHLSLRPESNLNKSRTYLSLVFH